MAAPYTTVSITGYNDNPPPDDGTESEENRVLWETIKEKLPDPLHTAIEAIDAGLLTAFAKVLGGAGVVSSAISAAVGAGDQGKLYRATGAGITITTPDATSVTAPFVFGFLNNSTGVVTLDGSGAQTVNGVANVTIPIGGGGIVFTDGSNWFITGLGGVLAGKQLGYADIINGTITESNGTNAATFALKTLAGADPSTDDPVLLCFRNDTLATGNYVYRTVTAALSLVLSSGSTLGTSSGVAFRLWIVIFDDGGTIRMGAINCRSGTNIYPLGRSQRVSSTAEGGSGGADSAHVFYTGSAVSSKPFLVAAYATYETGIATAGSWNASPTVLQLFGRGVQLPGAILQTQRTATGAVATGTTVVPNDDTIPQSNEGTELMTQAITPTSAANILDVEVSAIISTLGAANSIIAALFRDAVADALVGVHQLPTGSTAPLQYILRHEELAASASATTFKLRAGPESSNTMTFNGQSGGRKLGGVMNSYMRVEEIMA